MIENPLNQEIDRLFPPLLSSDGNSFVVGHEGYNIGEGYSLNFNILPSSKKYYTVDMQC